MEVSRRLLGSSELKNQQKILELLTHYGGIHAITVAEVESWWGGGSSLEMAGPRALAPASPLALARYVRRGDSLGVGELCRGREAPGRDRDLSSGHVPVRAVGTPYIRGWLYRIILCNQL
jgi:hypothetical protein